MSYCLLAGSGWIILNSLASSQHNLYDINLLLCMQYQTPDDGQKTCPKLEFYSKNIFEKLVHLVGFIIRICHDARSAEGQICHDALSAEGQICHDALSAEGQIFLQTKFNKAGPSHSRDRKAFIGWNIFTYKQCFLLKLCLAIMIKVSPIFLTIRKSQYFVIFMPGTKYISCVFVRASLHMRREEKPTRCH